MPGVEIKDADTLRRRHWKVGDGLDASGDKFIVGQMAWVELEPEKLYELRFFDTHGVLHGAIQAKPILEAEAAAEVGELDTNARAKTHPGIVPPGGAYLFPGSPVQYMVNMLAEGANTGSCDYVKCPVDVLADKARAAEPEAPRVTDEAVELAARALCESVLRFRLSDADWKRMRDSDSGFWLRLARACLEAVWGGEKDAD